MKEYLNRKEFDDGSIIIKMVKMGMDIDDETNHRIRGIVPTEDGKYLFVEIFSGNRFKQNHFKNMSKLEYEKKYPYENYIFCDFCFRVDIPKDCYNNYTPEFKNIEKKAFYDMNYNKDDIIKFFQKLNKNIKDVELVDDNYIDKYKEQHGFYRLYDDRLDHEYIPIKVTHKTNKDVIFDANYICRNYNNSVEYSEIKSIHISDYDINELKEEYGEKIIKLFDEYDKKIDELISSIKEKTDDGMEM